jgi:hypothetical protein
VRKAAQPGVRVFKAFPSLEFFSGFPTGSPLHPLAVNAHRCAQQSQSLINEASMMNSKGKKNEFITKKERDYFEPVY